MIKTCENGQILTKGKYEIINYKTILISELPIGTWIDNYKTFIDEIVTDLTLPPSVKSKR